MESLQNWSLCPDLICSHLSVNTLLDMSEWLRSQTRNLLGFACAGSNPDVDVSFYFLTCNKSRTRNYFFQESNLLISRASSLKFGVHTRRSAGHQPTARGHSYSLFIRLPTPIVFFPSNPHFDSVL